MTDGQNGRRHGVDGPPRTAPVATLDVPADLTVYAALVGCHPRIDPSLADPVAAAAAAVRADPWSPAALGVYVSAVVRRRGATVTAKLNRPQVAAWVRRQSAAARRRLAEARSRASAPAVVVATPAPWTDEDD